MKRAVPIFVLILALGSMLTVGCATLSNRSKTIISMVGLGLVAGSVGAYMAPHDEKQLAHAALWGGPTAAVTGVISLYVFDEQSVSRETERKLQVATRELDALRGESVNSDSQLISEAESSLFRDLPLEYRSLVRPGKWSIYQTNVWLPQGENTLVHQDKILRIEPPHLRPKSSEQFRNSSETGEGK